MSSPVAQTTGTEVLISTDSSVSFSQRMQCQSGFMFYPENGGMSFVFGDYSAYFPFAYQGGDETVSGDYQYRECRGISKTKN